MSTTTPTTWNISIEDTSSLFAYDPYPEVSEPAHGWAQQFSESGFIGDAGNHQGQLGKGESAHVTSVNGSSFTLDFWGRGINLYGSANASYNVVVDNVTQTPIVQDGLLFSSSSLSVGQHNLKLIAMPKNGSSEQLWFDRVDIYMDNSQGDRSSPKETVVDNNDPLIVYSPKWETGKDTINPSPFHSTDELGETLSFQFNESRVVTLRGRTDDAHGVYSVTIDNDSPEIFDGWTSWQIENNTLYSKVFPTPALHMLKVSVLEKAFFDLSSIHLFDGYLVNVTSNNGTEPPVPSPSGAPNVVKREIPVGTIVGTAIGSLAFSFICTIGVLYWYRCKRKSSAHSRDVPEKSLPQPNPSITPFWMKYVDSSGSENCVEPPEPATVPTPLNIEMLAGSNSRSVLFEPQVRLRNEGPPSYRTHSVGTASPLPSERELGRAI